ncbi:MAG: hypothetical protein OXK77_16995 [Gemmatimonadota bacterium]|nr:hypothetical protein [Gemmatimonadota bacterium]MDE2865770.1 hypothetical protein [Gemmatimonadota bacterium]MXV94320.1 hypothetical protein [Gemmatimonadota bacterium]MYE18111.1 hypothetical protein [Gemmatimonadota bacterium]
MTFPRSMSSVGWAGWILAGALLMAGCGDEEDPVEPDDAPPDLSGTYTLVSIVALVTGGTVMTPPDATGTFTLRQSTPVGQEASGTMTMDITIPDGLGGTTDIVDTGTYTVRRDGTWEQAGNLVQARGTYTFVNNVLTVEVTEPPLNVSTTVWQRQ